MVKRVILTISIFAILLILTACGDNQDAVEILPEEEIEAYEEETVKEAIEEVFEEYEEYEEVEEYEAPILTLPIGTPQRVRIAAVGDIIEFGDYNWIVLDVQDNYALIITERAYILREGGYWHEIWGPITWGASSIRRYLNDDFYNRFSEADRMRIRETYVKNNDNPWNDTDLWYSSTGGENTTDKIFFLSVEEVVRYFGDSGQMDDRPEGIGPLRFINWISDEHDYARIGRDDTGTALSWWLRTPGANQRLVTFIDPNGVIAMYGTSSPQTPVAARPALWLSLEYEAVHHIRDWEDFAWTLEHFNYIRAPLRFYSDMPHGHLALQHILFMNDNLYGRKPFSYREKEAAAWLVEELLAMGHPWENISIQEFDMVRESHWTALTNNPRFRSDLEFRHTARLSQNVILTVPGQSDSGQFIVVGAHYDSHPYPGASDNASGVSLLLESAQRILRMDNYYTIVYIFFGAEENGLWGSNYFANSLTYELSDNLVMMINADVLFEGSYLFYSAAYSYNCFQPRQNALSQQIDDIAYGLDLGLIRYPYVLPNINTDHLPFFLRGYTVVNLMGLHRVEHPGVQGIIQLDGGTYMLRVYHSPNDDFRIIEERWPGKIETNMRAFSIFLEELLLADFY
jgi:hypothetical protein